MICHDPHSVKLHSYENQLCTRCHVPNDKTPQDMIIRGIISTQLIQLELNVFECHMPHKTTWGSIKDEIIALDSPT